MSALSTISILAFLLFVVVLILGVINPKLSSWFYKLFGKSSASRKFVAATMIPASIVAMMIGGATTPAEPDTSSSKPNTSSIQEVVHTQMPKEDSEKTKDTSPASPKKPVAKQKTSQPKKSTAPKPQPLTQQPAQSTPSAPTKKPTPKKTVTKKSSHPRASSNSAVQGAVHPGAFCTPYGATGHFTNGNPAICKTAKDGRNRWQSR